MASGSVNECLCQLDQLLRPKIKFIWKDMANEPSIDTLPSSFFEKYKLGLAHHLAPFRLFPTPPLSFATSMSTSGDEMDSRSED